MDHASWTGLPSNSAGAGPDARPGLRPAAGAGPLGPIGAAGETRLGEVGAMCACRGRLAVHRSVHALESWQYQRMSAQAWPPSGTSRAVESAIPHNEHWADGKGRLRSSRCVAIDESPHVNWRLIAGPPALRTPWTEASPKLARQMWP